MICSTTALLALCAEASLAAFPGRPGPIAYSKTIVRELGGGETLQDGGIYARDLGRRGGPRQLTVSPLDREPSYSANGRHLVFLSASGRPWLGSDDGLFEVNRQGRARREVRPGGGAPSFFPNGNRILFAEEDESGFSHIYSARANNTGLRQLTSGSHNDSEPAISPNGRRIAFVSDRDGDGSDIFTMRSNGTGVRLLIDGPGRESAPDYAPGGNRIAFSSSRGQGASNIFVARADGRQVRRLTRCASFPGCPAFSAPAFSPNGARIAVLRSTARSSAVVVIRADRRRPPLVRVDSGSTDGEGSGTTVGPPTWGPRPR